MINCDDNFEKKDTLQTLKNHLMQGDCGVYQDTPDQSVNSYQSE